MTKAVYYPRVKTINFYDPYGNITGGMRGNIATRKFWKLIKKGEFPRLSLSKEVKYSIN